MSRYMGDSEKMVAAIFSLARKLAPSVIFFDEMDCIFVKTLNDGWSMSAALRSMKAQFLTLMDGITTQNTKEAPVMVLGATNHPEDIDEAILRRMSRSFQVPMPNAKAREKILELLLKDQPMEEVWSSPFCHASPAIARKDILEVI